MWVLCASRKEKALNASQLAVHGVSAMVCREGLLTYSKQKGECFVTVVYCVNWSLCMEQCTSPVKWHPSAFLPRPSFLTFKEAIRTRRVISSRKLTKRVESENRENNMAENKTVGNLGGNLGTGAGIFAKRVQKSFNRAQEKVSSKCAYRMLKKKFSSKSVTFVYSWGGCGCLMWLSVMNCAAVAFKEAGQLNSQKVDSLVGWLVG